VKRQWVRPYLGYYLRLVEDDRYSILENSPISRHSAAREEELFKNGTVNFKCLVTLLYQGVEGGLQDVALVKVGSIVAGVSTLHA
jgi:hypothetical protein